MILFFKLHQKYTLFALMLLLGGMHLSNAQVTGPTSVNTTSTYTYQFNNGQSSYPSSWIISGGTLQSSWQSGSTYYVTAIWNGGMSNGTVVFTPTNNYLYVTITSPAPSTPSTPTIQSTNCGNTVLARGTPPSGVTWYWQSSSSGTSTSNSSSTITKTSSGTQYLRAKSGSTWSTSSSSKSYTVTQATTWYEDQDGDGLGNPASTQSACSQPSGYVSNNSDQCPTQYGTSGNNGCPTYNFSDENYIHTTAYRVSTTSGNVNDDEKTESITYYDGLGRPMQSIGIRAGADLLNNNLINWKDTWTLGSGSAPFFSQNGATSENERIMGTDPYGNTSMLWKCGNDSSSDADGGWNTPYFSVDKTVGYRYTVWVKRTGSQDGRTYHGTHNVNGLNGAPQGNPYFFNGDLPTLDDWYLIVGIIHPYTHGTTHSGISGVYDTNGNKVIGKNDFKWRSTTTTANFRSYLYYATDTNVRQYFYDPIVQRLDGNEASIQDIIEGHKGKDIVAHIDYDDFGRQDKDYLPFATTTNDGFYRTGALTSTNSFYNTTKYENTTNPYSEKHLESSPLNRVLEQGAPGADWVVNKTSDSDHTIKFDYLSNTSGDNVRIYKVNITSTANNTYTPQLTGGGTYYDPGELYKTVTKDENWTSGTNHTTEEFKDKQGRVVLKRTHNNGDHDTYYVYDDYGNLTYVLPPKVVHDASISSTEMDELCYQYKYDHRNRLVEKKIPGKGSASDWEEIVYNKLDQPIMMRDAKMKGENKWAFTLYDAYGRVAYSGLDLNNSSSRVTLQNAANAASKQYVTKTTSSNNYSGAIVYYSKDAYPVSFEEVHTINYYDDYEIGSQITFNPANGSGTWEGMTASTNTKGLPTVVRVKVLGTTDDWVTTATYYDEKGRAWETHVKNEYLGTDDWTLNKLDFVGNVIKSWTSHTKSGQTVTVEDNFSYDHAGRLISQKQKINSLAEELIAQNSYGALGQLINKNVGGKTSQGRLQNVDYTYNIRGWLKQINNPSSIGNDLFSFKLNYNTKELGASNNVLYNGNISETIWKTANDVASNKTRGYAYTYDALNRITDANYGVKTTGAYYLNSGFDVGIGSYDKNGNIESLWRDDVTYNHKIDQLTYTYSNNGVSNKLSIVSDAVLNTSSLNEEFKDDHNSTSTDSSIDYTYDANGNMLRDYNKGISSNITYNHLNLPTLIPLGGGNISYIYDAVGTKLSKTVSGVTTYYAGNYVYEGSSLKFFNHAEGYVDVNGSSYSYAYQYKDHLSNVRLSYKDSNNNGIVDSAEILEENNYYPFGLKHKGYNTGGTSHIALKWKYNSTEYEEAHGLNLYEMDVRSYDPAIARFTGIDPVTHHSNSTYTAFDNNPVIFADPSGADSETMFKSSRLGSHWSDSFRSEDETTTEDIVEEAYDNTPEKGASITNFETEESYQFSEDEINDEVSEGSNTKYEELPSFAELLKNYITYDIGTVEFGKIVGGKVEQNTASGVFNNTCALRVCHALNMSGHSVPYIKGQTSSSKDKKWYIFRVSILDAYMNKTFGPADIIDTRKSSFLGHQGVIMFKVDIWTDATGHFTLWDGKNRIGGNYGTDFYFNNSSKVKLWKAK